MVMGCSAFVVAIIAKYDLVMHGSLVYSSSMVISAGRRKAVRDQRGFLIYRKNNGHELVVCFLLASHRGNGRDFLWKYNSNGAPFELIHG